MPRSTRSTRRLLSPQWPVDACGWLARKSNARPTSAKEGQGRREGREACVWGARARASPAKDTSLSIYKSRRPPGRERACLLRRGVRHGCGRSLCSTHPGARRALVRVACERAARHGFESYSRFSLLRRDAGVPCWSCLASTVDRERRVSLAISLSSSCCWWCYQPSLSAGASAVFALLGNC